MAHGEPGFRSDPVVAQEREQGELLPVGMQFDLIDDRRDPGLRQEALEVRDREVAHADGADQAPVDGILHAFQTPSTSPYG